jgi:hypothetical protein
MIMIIRISPLEKAQTSFFAGRTGVEKLRFFSLKIGWKIGDE